MDTPFVETLLVLADPQIAYQEPFNPQIASQCNVYKCKAQNQRNLEIFVGAESFCRVGDLAKDEEVISVEN